MKDYESVKNKILDKADIVNGRYYEIYKMTCDINGKAYIGQTVSHVLNHKRYRPYGARKRVDAHFSEAFSKKYGQCSALNADIVKYGSGSFSFEILMVCDEKDSSILELEMMTKHDTLYPKGYNIIFRDNKCIIPKSVEKFVNTTSMPKPNDKYLVRTSQYGILIGWRVRIPGGKDTAFTSQKLTADENKKLALEFIQQVREYIERRDTL